MNEIIKVGALPPLDNRERKKRKREIFAIILFLVTLAALSYAEFRIARASTTLPFVNSIFFFGLVNVNIIILMALVWLIFRNIGKVFIERRRNILGSRLKTKLIIAFLSFSIIPTIVLFIISALYINSSFDKWFSVKIQNTLQASLDITGTYYRNMDATAMHFADHLAKSISDKFKNTTLTPIIGDYLSEQRELLALDALEYYFDSFEERLINSRKQNSGFTIEIPRLSLDLLNQTFNGEKVNVLQHIGTGDLIRSLVPVKRGSQIVGMVVVNTYVPVSLVNKVDEIASVFDDYKGTNPLKYPMKTAYFIILIMITLVIIFVAIWVGLYMARELTTPVDSLVQGAAEVGSGNLDVEIVGVGHDELAVLVNSFNKMIRDLRENRHSLEHTRDALEKRRTQLEAVLTNVGTGVLVVDKEGVITTFNHALSKLLDIAAETALGKHFEELLRDSASPMSDSIRRCLEDKSGKQEIAQWNFRTGDVTRSLAAVSTALKDSIQPQPWGAVVVVDDMTHLIKAQREMAWREVARRIAHEIKNPLTPIKLSAQRLQRRMSNYRGRDAEILQECTETIIKHVDEMKDLVNEFSSFARFPEVTPAPNDLNQAISEVISLYQQAHPSIQFRFDSESRLPVFEFDRDQMKRVLINLLDNAVAALLGVSNQKHLVIIESHFNENLQMAVVDVKDNGSGMSEDVKSHLFEPYFSTKDDGTGLGLAIAKRIVNDHDGYIRVQSILGEGTQFIIELPTAVRHDLNKKDES